MEPYRSPFDELLHEGNADAPHEELVGASAGDHQQVGWAGPLMQAGAVETRRPLGFADWCAARLAV